MKDRDALIAQLIDHEGLRLKPYTDTVGKLTIGVGRNLDDVGISRDEALALLQNDIDACLADLSAFPWFDGLDTVRQRAVVDFRFNLGPGGFRAFRKFLAAMARADYEAAAGELVSSKWYGQVGRRGPVVVGQVRTGV